MFWNIKFFKYSRSPGVGFQKLFFPLMMNPQPFFVKTLALVFDKHDRKNVIQSLGEQASQSLAELCFEFAGGTPLQLAFRLFLEKLPKFEELTQDVTFVEYEGSLNGRDWTLKLFAIGHLRVPTTRETEIWINIEGVGDRWTEVNGEYDLAHKKKVFDLMRFGEECVSCGDLTTGDAICQRCYNDYNDRPCFGCKRHFGSIHHKGYPGGSGHGFHRICRKRQRTDV